MRATQKSTRERQAQLRRAILDLVGRERMTEADIITELESVASTSRVKRQVAYLVGRSHITRVDLPDGTHVYEHWNLTMQRVRELNDSGVRMLTAKRAPSRVA